MFELIIKYDNGKTVSETYDDIDIARENVKKLNNQPGVQSVSIRSYNIDF